MDGKQEFTIASKRDAEQKRLAEDQERLREIARLQSQKEQEHHKLAIGLREEKLKIEAERADREEEAIVQREIRDKAANKHEMHLTMKGVEGLNPNQKEQIIRQSVRNTHGAELDQHREEIRVEMNEMIDNEIKQSLERQERENTNEQSAKRPWESATLSQDSKRPWESDLTNDQGLERKREP